MVKSSGAPVSPLRLAAVRRGHRWAALVVLCASALIINVDNTILNVALPTLVRKLAANSSELQWIVDSYAMVFAGLLLVGGSLLAVAARAGGATGALLAHAARAAFMSGTGIALAVGAAVALGGVVLVLARLPLRVSRDSPDPQRRTVSTGPSPDAHPLIPTAYPTADPGSGRGREAAS